MGWLDTLFDVTMIGLEVSQLSQLHQLKTQGASAQVMAAILQELRSRIHYYNQTAQKILAAEAGEPRAAAGAMRILEKRLMDSGITPDLFPALADMDYVSNTYRIIQVNSSRMCSQLSAADQAALERVARQADELPELSYYLNQYDNYMLMLQAKRVYEQQPWMSSRLKVGGAGCLISSVMLVASIFLSTISVFLSRSAIGMLIVVVLGLGLTAGWFYLLARLFLGSRKYREAKSTLDRIGQSIDLQRVEAVHNRFGGNRAAVQHAYQQAQAEIHAFFGNSTLLPA